MSVISASAGCAPAKPSAPLVSGCTRNCDPATQPVTTAEVVLDASTADVRAEAGGSGASGPQDAAEGEAAVVDLVLTNGDSGDVTFLGQTLVMSGACFLGKSAFEGAARAIIVDGSGGSRTKTVEQGRFSDTCQRGYATVGLLQPGFGTLLYPTLTRVSVETPQIDVFAVDRATLEVALQVIGRPADGTLAYAVIQFTRGGAPVPGVTVSLSGGGSAYYCSDGAYLPGDSAHATGIAGTALLVEIPAPPFPGAMVAVRIGESGATNPRDVSLPAARGFVTVAKEVLP